MSVISSALELTSPFPGLRPFRPHEDAIFFGRHEQVSDMLQRLETCRLLTVVGASGCGKSSLVRAGLLPALRDGLLFGAGSDWKTVMFRPGTDPYPEFARALGQSLPAPNPSDSADWTSYIQAMLLSGDNGLIRVVNEAGLPQESNVLVLVDQFEELFRFRSVARSQGEETAEKQQASYEERNNANAFVNLLLETVRRQSGCEAVSGWLRTGGMTSGLTPKHPISVVLTMRSEFLGHCDAFLGLPEAVSQSQFLTPRMTREQLKDAIVRPLEVFGAVAHPALVNRVLNDVGTDPDSLPLMQHALLRTWQNAKQRLETQPLESRQKGELRIADYEKAGGLQRALSLHADEAYAELGRDPVHGELYQDIARQLFLLLCRQTSEGVMVRNPIQVAEAAAITGVSAESILHVSKVFCNEGRNFITSSGGDHDLTPDSILDISHESLIRNWDTLKAWIETEIKSAADYAWVLQAAEVWKAKGGNLFHGANLRIALAWKQKARPSARWAVSYGGDFDLAMRFLEESKKRHRYRLILGAALAGFVVLAPFLYGLQHMSFLRELADKQQAQLATQSALLKANEQLQEIGDAARAQSQYIFAKAEELLKDKDNPRAPALALAQLSRALDRDRHNVAAAERACTLLLNRTWCSPLTPPLRYSSENAILSATFDPDGDGTRVLAVSQDGWLIRSDDQGKALVRKQLLAEEIDGKKINLVSASFSPDGRALMLIWARDEARKIVQFGSLVDGFCKLGGRLEVDHYSVYNTITWSADQKLIIVIPARWDDIGPCRAFYFTGTSYVSIDKPFDGSPVLAVAFDPGSDVIATASPTASVQFWQLRGGAFEKLPDTPTSHSGFNLQEQHIRSMRFGPTKEELFLVTSGSGSGVQVQRINVPANVVENFGFAPIKDQFLKLVAGPRTSGRQLIATSLYSRVSINYSAAWDFASALAEPICFQGATALSMFDITGSKLMTLSGFSWLAPDTVQVWDVSMRIKGEPVGEFHAGGNPAPPWLAVLARAVSGIPRMWDIDDNAAVLSDVFIQTAPDTLYSPYDKVWKHFFQEQTGSAHESEIEHGKESVILVNDKRSAALSDKPNVQIKEGSQHPDFQRNGQ
jgi:WD40 repeat protein